MVMSFRHFKIVDLHGLPIELDIASTQSSVSFGKSGCQSNGLLELRLGLRENLKRNRFTQFRLGFQIDQVR